MRRPTTTRSAGPVVLAVDVGGTKLAAGLVDDSGQVLAIAARWPPPSSGRAGATSCSGCWSIWSTGCAPRARARDRRARSVCGVGSGGPMPPGGGRCRPSTSRPGATTPCGPGWPITWRPGHLRRQRRQGAGPGRGLAGGGPGGGRLPGHGGVHRGRGRGGGRRRPCWTGPRATPATSATSTWSPRAGRVDAAARGCLEAEASGTAIAEITGAPPAQAGPEVVERVGTLVGRAVADVAVLLDLRLAVVAGSVALGYGAPFFDAAQAEIDRRARLDYARGCPHRARRAGRRRSAGGRGGRRPARAWAAAGGGPGSAPGPQ